MLLHDAYVNNLHSYPPQELRCRGSVAALGWRMANMASVGAVDALASRGHGLKVDPVKVMCTHCSLARTIYGAYADPMERGIVVRGRLQGRHIELDEEVDELDGEVEVFLRATGSTPRPPDVLEVIRKLPPGTRTKDEMDRQLADERADWANRE